MSLSTCSKRKSQGLMAIMTLSATIFTLTSHVSAQSKPPSEPLQLPGFQTAPAPVGGALEIVSPPPVAKPVTKPTRKKTQASSAVAPISNIEAGQMSGRYAILRDGGKDTGCMVTLDDKASGPSHSYKAILAPACRDQGIVIFDPAGWEVDGEKLLLIARKGHENHFVLQPDKTWIKDASEGKPMILKKL